MIRAIVAVDDRLGLATDSGIPWDVPADRAYFRQTTTSGLVLMGFTTYQEFDEPLPQRRNLVATHRDGALRPGFERVADLNPFLAAHQAPDADDVWVIGGAGLYAATVARCDELYLTRVEGDFGCTKFFPPFTDDFTLAGSRPAQRADGVPAARFEIWRHR